jgi:hypothetical protein
MWRTAAALEHLPVGTKTELGDGIIRRVKTGDYNESELWCLSRLGARELFYGPINLVVPAATVTRWIDALPQAGGAGEAIARMARRTGNSTLDLAAGTLDSVRRKLGNEPSAERLLALLEGDSTRDLDSLGRMFGEELPSGLVFSGEL